jgi:hypothetical protein
MIHIRKEGQPVRFGFNFYPLSDKGSAGFVLKITNRLTIWFRYSKVTKQWNIGK